MHNDNNLRNDSNPAPSRKQICNSRIPHKRSRHIHVNSFKKWFKNPKCSLLLFYCLFIYYCDTLAFCFFICLPVWWSISEFEFYNRLTVEAQYTSECYKKELERVPYNVSIVNKSQTYFIDPQTRSVFRNFYKKYKFEAKIPFQTYTLLYKRQVFIFFLSFYFWSLGGEVMCAVFFCLFLYFCVFLCVFCVFILVWF